MLETSTDFSYESIHYTVKCDASYHQSKAGISWVIENHKSGVEIAEGVSLIRAENTGMAEISSVKMALNELKQLSDQPNVIIRTDYEGIIDALETDESLLHELSCVGQWAVEVVERDKISRPHDLANYSLSEYSLQNN